MRFAIRHGGSGYAAVNVQLKKGETVKAESDAMVTKSQHVDIAGRLSGGLLGGLARAFLTNESLFLQELTATQGDDNDVLFAPAYPGDVMLLEPSNGNEFIIAQGAFLCADSSVQINTHTQGWAQGMFSKQGLFLLRARGPGTLAVCAFGAIERYDLRRGEIRDIDNGHLVAWSADMQYSMAMASASWVSSVTSGEGLVCRFTGPGTVYVQTRNLQGLREWVGSRSEKSNSTNPCVLILFLLFFMFIIGVVGFLVLQGDNVVFSSRTQGGRLPYNSRH